MLDFFRRNQRYFFFVITVVIVISFSFFGTYSTIPAANIREQVAFVAIDGTEVKRSDLEEMTLFLSSDLDDKVIFGGVWGPNFLNDGVIKKDFLQTGLAEILAAQYEPVLAADLQKKLEKEKRYNLYAHPEANFINIESVWDYFAPEMKTNYSALKQAKQATNEEALNARVRLYLGERRLPPPLVRQVLRYQEKQYNWITPDQKLDRTDLSLFGYHTLDDWFGPHFIRIIGEFIINASKVAEQKGYIVTKEEAWADLIHNAQLSYQQNIQNPNLGVANSAEYINEQLHRMRMDQSMAVKIWRQVLLFRRLFQDIGLSVFVDPFSFEQVNAFAKESASGELYQLPQELHLHSYQDLQKFETYLTATSKRPSEDSKTLMLPTEFLSAAEVAKNYPELVQKRYFLEVSQVDKSNLQAKVPVKESWSWQVENKNWEKLKKEFPELGVKTGNTPEERFSALESLDNRTRTRVDAYARNAWLDEHPEWMENALKNADAKHIVVGISEKGNGDLFKGIKDPKKLMNLLDTAPLAGEMDKSSDKEKKSQEALNHYTDNHQKYFYIRVIERKPDWEILTFAEANKKGVLDIIVDRQLEEYYKKVQSQYPATFQKEDKSWKSFSEARSSVADLYYAKSLNAIRNDYTKAIPKEKKNELSTGDLTAPYRLYSHVRNASAVLMKTPEKSIEVIRESPKHTDNEKFADREPLANQWKLEKIDYRVERSGDEKKLNPAEVFPLALDGWTQVQTLPNGEIYFFHKTGNEASGVSTLVAEKIDQARRILSDDAQKAYMRQLVADIKAKNAISLDYLNQSMEMTEELPQYQEG